MATGDLESGVGPAGSDGGSGGARGADGRECGDAGVAESLTVEVARTGGVAGITRRWQAAPDPPAAQHWHALIEACPWEQPAPGPGDGADRFTWEVCVDLPAERREAALPESAATGPWRELIDEVRAWHRRHQPPAG